MEREPQPQPPIVRYTEAAKEYAAKEAENSPQFKMAVAEIGRNLGSDQNPKAKEAAENLIKQGIGMITHKISMLPAFANPENRAQIMEKLKKDKVEGAWIDILNNWDINRDRYGVNVLQRCKDADLEELMAKARSEKDPNKKKQIEIQAKAIEKGQDLIINFYIARTNEEPSQRPLLMAA